MQRVGDTADPHVCSALPVSQLYCFTKAHSYGSMYVTRKLCHENGVFLPGDYSGPLGTRPAMGLCPYVCGAEYSLLSGAILVPSATGIQPLHIPQG